MADGEGTTTTATAAGDGQENNSTQTNGTQVQGQQATTTDPADGGVDVAKLQAEVERYKREAEAARVKAKGAVADQAKRDQLLAFAQAIGIDLPKGQEETVESLQAKLQQEVTARQEDQTKVVQASKAQALVKAAWTNGVDPAKAEYLEFLVGKNPDYAQLDPSKGDFQTSVDAIVKSIVETDPTFKATPGGATKSGADGFGGAGPNGEVTQEAFDKMSIAEQTNLYRTNPALFNRLSGVGG